MVRARRLRGRKSCMLFLEKSFYSILWRGIIVVFSLVLAAAYCSNRRWTNGIWKDSLNGTTLLSIFVCVFVGADFSRWEPPIPQA
jgi:hypothetical protein